jgi:hypothetical protein
MAVSDSLHSLLDYESSLLLWRMTNEKSLLTLTNESESYITTDGQSASLSCNKAPIWGLWPDFITVWQSSRVLCYDRRSFGQSILVSSTNLGLTTRFSLLSDCYGVADVGRSLWREDGSVVYNCCWSSPAQSFSGPSPVGLTTIFYCLWFETSLFVVSYGSQGYGGGIRHRLHTRLDPTLSVSVS